MALLESSSFYLTLSFLGFVVLIYHYAYQPFINFLDAYIAKINQTLKQAEEQKEAVRSIFQEESLKLQKVDQEVANILTAAEQQCEILRHNIKAEILAETTEQEHRLKTIVERMNHDFIYQLNDQISDKIINSVKEWIDNHSTDEIQELSQKRSISLLDTLKSLQ
jgi:F0F1-type ATP synthase membrane subunit b/b'